MRQIKATAVSVALVFTAYLLTFSPPFSHSYNSLFIFCVTLSSWHYGVRSGLLAWLLGMALLVWKLDPWPARGPMSYTSFSSACLVIIWLIYRHDIEKEKLRVEMDRRRVHEMTRAKEALGQTIHDLTDALSAMLAECQMSLWNMPETLDRIENAALRAAALVKNLRNIRDLL